MLKMIAVSGKTVIVVTHNQLIKQYCDVLYIIDDGKLVEENYEQI